MDKNYFVKGIGFYHYAQARMYADHLLKTEGKYHAVYTKAEMDSVIDHETECGK